MGQMKRRDVAGGMLLALVLSMFSAAQAPSFKVPYANTFDPNATLKVKLGFSAAPKTTFVVDTGSVGIVVPRTELPRSVSKAVDGSIRYTSSGLVVDGFWTEPIDVTLDTSGAIARVPVFAAETSHCVVPASNPCRDGSLPHMMGVGFGRPDAYATPDRNPLLHIRNLPPGTPANYRITQTGIELGVAHPLAIKGLHTLRLTRWTRSGLHNEPVTDDRTPSGFLRMNTSVPQPVSILVDTGITDALLTLVSGEPAACASLARKADASCRVADGTRLSLSMLHGASSLAFTVGDDGPATPDAVHWIHLNSQEGSFINTGMHLLAKFDVFYDYTSGVFGLDPVSP